MDIVVITGVSGSGKSVALHVLEDAGYYCVDNLPCRLLPQLPNALANDGYAHLAVAIDVRNSGSIAELPGILNDLRQEHSVRVLFLNTSTATLVQRFSETRRPHPLTLQNPATSHLDEQASLIEAIEYERELLTPLIALGQQIDSSHLRSNALRSWINEFISQNNHPPQSLTLTFESFGFKHGVPLDADFVFDVRPLPNPHYDLTLRPLTGLDQPIIDFLAPEPLVQNMIADIKNFVERWLPVFVQDNRAYLTIAIGCTGGQHRSVFIAETLAQHFRQDRGSVLTRHREQIARQSHNAAPERASLKPTIAPH
jgi:RNase adapter protein RapZ